jgi:hypothetical protein
MTRIGMVHIKHWVLCFFLLHFESMICPGAGLPRKLFKTLLFSRRGGLARRLRWSGPEDAAKITFYVVL